MDKAACKLQYDVTGMTCAACQAHVEKAVAKVPGVTNVSVNLLTNSMRVEGTAAPAEVEAAVAAVGYGATQRNSGAANSGAKTTAARAAAEDALVDRETPVMVRRLTASVAVLLVLMYFSMGVHMWGWPMPPFMVGNHVAMGLMQMLLALIILFINRKFFVSGFKGLAHGAPNMDTLIAIGAGTSFGYSLVMLFYMTYAQVHGGSQAAAPLMNEFYFESAAMILTLITVGKTLEAYSKGRTTDALKGLMKLAPKTAQVMRGGEEVTVPIEEVQVGDLFVVRPGEQIPVDGEVVEGNSAINEAALTGESLPVDKAPGDTVASATLNQSGFLTCRATRVGEDTTLSQIIAMVSDAAETKAPVAKLADKISGIFVPAVLGIAAVVLVIWLIVTAVTTGQVDIGLALQRSISVLVVSCPCALGLATPVAIMVGNGVGAKHGILFKTAEALQETGGVQIVALDKTGTITSGTPQVTDLLPAKGVTQEELLQKAAALEAKSEHPLAKAVLERAQANGGHDAANLADALTDFQAMPGHGLTGALNGKRLWGGNAALLREAPWPVAGAAAAEQAEAAAGAAGNAKARPGSAADPSAQLTAAVRQGEALAAAGKTPLYFAEEGRFLGVIAVADTIKEDSAEAIRQMKNMGLRVVMLSGDNQRTATAIGREAGVNEVIADVKPDGKEAVIRGLQQQGKTIMIGDGINDAPALTRADIGMAIGAGTDIAVDAADVVLMKSRLTDAAAAIRLSRQTYRDIKENLFWALIYNVLLIPLAAGAYAHFGFTMNPMWGAAAMGFSSVFVVGNALRLNLFPLYSTKHDHRRKAKRAHAAAAAEQSAQQASASAPTHMTGVADDNTTATKHPEEEETMQETVKIEGMMCGHCEMTVKKALEALDGVESAVVSHESGTAELTLSKEVPEAEIKKAIEDKDYKFVAIA